MSKLAAALVDIYSEPLRLAAVNSNFSRQRPLTADVSPRMSQFFVHNGYLGWSYGTPADPQLISPADAATLMQAAGLALAQVEQIIPPAQYAALGDHLFLLTGGNRFLYCGHVQDCADVHQDKIKEPLAIDWHEN